MKRREMAAYVLQGKGGGGLMPTVGGERCWWQAWSWIGEKGAGLAAVLCR